MDRVAYLEDALSAYSASDASDSSFMSPFTHSRSVVGSGQSIPDIGSCGGSDMSSVTQSSQPLSLAGSGVHAARAFAAQRQSQPKEWRRVKSEPQNDGKRAEEAPNGHMVISDEEAREFEYLRKLHRQNMNMAAAQIPPPDQIRVMLPPQPPPPSYPTQYQTMRRNVPSTYGYRGGRGGGRTSN